MTADQIKVLDKYLMNGWMNEWWILEMPTYKAACFSSFPYDKFFNVDGKQ